MLKSVVAGGVGSFVVLVVRGLAGIVWNGFITGTHLDILTCTIDDRRLDYVCAGKDYPPSRATWRPSNMHLSYYRCDILGIQAMLGGSGVGSLCVASVVLGVPFAIP